MSNPLVSIIVPVYNVEKYLKKCIQNIIDQTYKNLEIILVDDGSSDNSGKICDEFAQKDNRIKVIHKINGGQADARNAGLDVMSGEWVSFIDSDDFVSPYYIENLYYLAFLNGGGNLGDLYGLHQKFREKIISKYLNNKIIILPQTIYFESNDNYNRCCEIFSKHKNLYIYTRDKNSFELAKKMSNFVYLSPDMAHKLYPIKYKNKADKESIFIKRKDKELLNDNYNIDTKALVIDWCDILGIHNYIISAFIRLNKLLSIFNIKFTHKFLVKLWIKYANFLVKKTVKVLSRYDVIYTTRMHGHILACLMDKENIVFDNSYGKNSNYIKQWTSSSKLVSLLK